ncbi:hypothetical protein HaLaN_01422 [Haematococcus lacustris]|uniref:Uncharacterized protein n=1 Tax=Haematococcus lacustris TaxID=44745 RepID=A0A699YBM5_HAELA|nr:hypothetical protein HaLaN_01422 [Haematococcus lacustris]
MPPVRVLGLPVPQWLQLVAGDSPAVQGREGARLLLQGPDGVPHCLVWRSDPSGWVEDLAGASTALPSFALHIMNTTPGILQLRPKQATTGPPPIAEAQTAAARQLLKPCAPSGAAREVEGAGRHVDDKRCAQCSAVAAAGFLGSCSACRSLATVSLQLQHAGTRGAFSQHLCQQARAAAGRRGGTHVSGGGPVSCQRPPGTDPGQGSADASVAWPWATWRRGGWPHLHTSHTAGAHVGDRGA